MKNRNIIRYFKTMVFAFICLFAVGVMNVNAETRSVTNHSELSAALTNPDVDVVKLGNKIIATDYLLFVVEPGSVTTKTLDLNGNTLDLGSGYNISLKNRDREEANFIIKDSGTTGKIIQTTNNNSPVFQTDASSATAKINLTIDGGKYEATQSGANGGFFYGSEDENENKIIIKNATVDGYVLFRGTLNKISVKNLTLANPEASDSRNTIAARLYEDSTRTYADILEENYEAVIKNPDNSEIAIPTNTELGKRINEISSSAHVNGAIVIREKGGLKVNNIALSETFGYGTPTAKAITIENTGKTALKIKNVSVNGTDFQIEDGIQATLNAGDTDTSWMIKAKDGLNAGTYTATITVTDMSGNEYTATVTLVVEKKQLDGLGAGFTSNWTYGETALEPNISGVGSLGADEYKVEYAKTGTDSWSTTKPKTAGDYTIRLTITGSNYVESSASSTFKILPTEKVVKIVANSSEHQYDGNAYTDGGYKIYFDGVEVTDGKLLYDDIIGNVKINGSVTDVADNTAVENNLIDRYSYTITNKESYKNIELVAGTIKITPILTPIIVTANSKTKTFDETWLTNDDYTYTDGVLLAGDELKATISGQIGFVGTTDNVVTNVKVMRGSKDITSNYTFGTHEKGTLTVETATPTININENLYVKVGETLTQEKIKELLASNTGYYDIKFVSGTAGTFNEFSGFTAGTTTGQVTMEVVAPARDVNGDGTPEYAEAKKTFYINVVDKENVTISGLTDNQEFTYDKTAKTPAGTISVDGNKVSVSELEVTYKGTCSTSYNSTTAPKNAGTYEVTYKVKDSNPNYVGSVTYAFTIKKAQLNKPTASTTSFVYDGTSKGYSSFHDNETFEFTGTNKATNVGNYSITISLKDKDNYEWKDGTTTDVVINWSITQATPDYTVPTGLVGVKGDFLRSIALPYGFTWNNPNELLNAGTHTYKATYTPADTTNYKTVTDIDVTVVVKNKFVLAGIVDGGNGTISVSRLEVLEGEKAEVVFTPDTGYMIDKVLVEETEVEVTGNKLELTMDGNKLVTVSYKKIPFTVTVKDVTGATITPNGAVSVNYGDDKEFTITVNSGYKLVKVLVNGADKTTDMVDDKLTLSNITANMKLEVVVEKIIYEVIEGANQKYIITKNNEVKFRINADYRLFDGKVYVDSILVDSKNYTSTSGSTIITFKKEFVDSLSAGEHTLKVTFTDGGETITTFTVANVTSENVTSENVISENVTSEVGNPKTGDNITDYIVAGILSFIGLAGAGVLAYRRKHTN